MQRLTVATVAVIDDDFSVRDSLKVLLEANGYAVFPFANGAEFFESEPAQNCACLVLDVDLPGQNGFEILSRLRRQGTLTPVILISGRATAVMRAKAKTAQTDLLEKPTPSRVLLAKIADLVGR